MGKPVDDMDIVDLVKEARSVGIDVDALLRDLIDNGRDAKFYVDLAEKDPDEAERLRSKIKAI